MAIKVAINGFGRIGRLVFRAIAERQKNIEVVAINDLAEPAALAYLLKFDSTQGRFPGEVHAEGDSLIVDGKTIKVFSERDPGQLPWKSLDIDVVVESTGFFRAEKTADKPGYDSHLSAGAKRVVISTATKGFAKMVVLGVNGEELTSDITAVSNASCTTNSLAPVAKVLDEVFGIEKGLMTTVHAYTSDQKIVDLVHSDWRRARAAATNIIPTSTNAAAAIGVVLPNLNGKLDGCSLRVPVPAGSITDLTATLSRDITVDEVNAAIKEAAHGSMKGIIEYSDEALVSSDIVHNPHSCIYDSSNTLVIGGNLLKCTMWYDNEWGYSCRTAELVEKLGAL